MSERMKDAIRNPKGEGKPASLAPEVQEPPQAAEPPPAAEEQEQAPPEPSPSSDPAPAAPPLAEGAIVGARNPWHRLPVLVALVAAVAAVLLVVRERYIDPRQVPEAASPPMTPVSAPPALPQGTPEPPSDLAGDGRPAPATPHPAVGTGTARGSSPQTPPASATRDALVGNALMGALHVVTEPPGAQVWIDGELVGETPLTAQELAGLVKIRVGKEGYRSFNRSLAIEAERRAELGPIVLEPLPDLFGQVVLFGVGLEGGAVAIDDGPRVELPARVELVAGIHRFKVFAPDGEVYTVAKDLAFDTARSTLKVDLQEL